MGVIYVDFMDREFYQAKKLVAAQLAQWGLDESITSIPKDAIACALDEVMYFKDQQQRVLILKKLEQSFTQQKMPSLKTNNREY